MRELFERLRSYLIWLIALPVFLAVCVFIILGSFVLRGRALEALLKTGCRAVLIACGVRVRTSGRGNVVPGRQYIAMMNHVNFFDPLVFQAAFRPALRGIEEESHFRWPVYGKTLSRLGMFPISRKNAASAIETLRRAAAWVRERPDVSFAIMPEGTRTRTGRLGPFKRGGFFMAIETGLDILPVVQRGASAINRKGSLTIRPGLVDVTLEPAIPTAGYSKENVGELIERVRRVFLDRLGESTS
ncbi:MAG: 1-acyl-sn-glycerol-3-phosphate acyltransferase [Candidatus Aminicenantes bacterium]|nr:MAG: 1-acyl-sn-glycerol-3-phosphate acyltransferase [Candidatus Aminicenantes bacterium]